MVAKKITALRDTLAVVTYVTLWFMINAPRSATAQTTDATVTILDTLVQKFGSSQNELSSALSTINECMSDSGHCGRGSAS